MSPTSPSKRNRQPPNPQFADWLVRVTRAHAHLRWVILLFRNPGTAGGQSLEGETFSARARRWDRTLVYDACGVAMDELESVRAEVFAVMESCRPTKHLPGTTDKVDAMERRAKSGYSLFIDADAKHETPNLD